MASFFLQIQLPADSIQKRLAELELSPLMEPDPVPFTFETIGWTVLAVMLLIVAVLSLWWQVRNYRKNAYRRLALAAIHHLKSEDRSLIESLVIVKRTAIDVFGRNRVGGLSGMKWLKFLEETGKDIKLAEYHPQIDLLLLKNIEPGVDDRARISEQIEKWIRTHAR